jgi:hypothetical protein
MTITTSSLVRDGGKAIDFVSDRIQAAEAALAQLTQPSRTINFVGCFEARRDLPQRSASPSQSAVHRVCSYGLPAVAGILFFCRF